MRSTHTEHDDSDRTDLLRPVQPVVTSAASLADSLLESATANAGLTYRRRAKAARKDASIAHLRDLPHRPVSERTNPSELPRWVKTALVYRTIYGETNVQVAERFKHSENTFSRWAQAPAAKLWISELERIADNPVQLAELIFKGNAVNVTLDYMALMETAIQSGDIKEARLMMQDWLKIAGLQADKPKSMTELRPTIVINLPSMGGTTTIQAEIPEGESSHERLIKPAEIIEEE